MSKKIVFPEDTGFAFIEEDGVRQDRAYLLLKHETDHLDKRYVVLECANEDKIFVYEVDDNNNIISLVVSFSF